MNATSRIFVQKQAMAKQITVLGTIQVHLPASTSPELYKTSGSGISKLPSWVNEETDVI
jgi:hypothetical protein